MAVIDIVLLAILLVFIGIGLKKGLIASVIHLAGLLVALVLIARFGPLVKIGLIERFQLNPIAAGIIAYLLIFLLIMILAKIIIIILQKFIKLLNLRWLDHLLGSIFGLLNGTVILVILCLLINIFPISEDIWELTDHSKVIKVVRVIAEEIEVKVIKKIPQPDFDQDKIEEKIEEKIKKVKDNI